MIPPFSSCQTTYKIILVTADDTQYKSEKLLILLDVGKVIHDFILFQIF